MTILNENESLVFRSWGEHGDCVVKHTWTGHSMRTEAYRYENSRYMKASCA